MFGEQVLVNHRKSKATGGLSGLFTKVLAVLCVAFAIWAAAGSLGEYISAGSSYETLSVVVRYGDTVWSVAKEYGPQGWDLRKTVDVIQELNGLSGADLGRLQPGQELRIPQ